MSVIIVEGPDGAGKSRLVERMATLPGNRPHDEFVTHHHGAYLGETSIAKHYLASLHAGFVSNVVMDRSWLSEPIYGAVMRGGVNRISDDELSTLEEAAINSKAIVILCMPSFGSCLNAWRSRRESEYPSEEGKLFEIYELYRLHAFSEWAALPRFFYDWQQDPYASSLLESVAKWREANR